MFHVSGKSERIKVDGKQEGGMVRWGEAFLWTPVFVTLMKISVVSQKKKTNANSYSPL